MRTCQSRMILKNRSSFSCVTRSLQHGLCLHSYLQLDQVHSGLNLLKCAPPNCNEVQSITSLEFGSTNGGLTIDPTNRKLYASYAVGGDEIAIQQFDLDHLGQQPVDVYTQFCSTGEGIVSHVGLSGEGTRLHAYIYCSPEDATLIYIDLQNPEFPVLFQQLVENGRSTLQRVRVFEPYGGGGGHAGHGASLDERSGASEVRLSRMMVAAFVLISLLA